MCIDISLAYLGATAAFKQADFHKGVQASTSSAGSMHKMI
jgi:hypothetical protein